MEWDGGSRSEGDLCKRLASRKGTYIWPSGDKHVGEYKNSSRHGKGVRHICQAGATKSGFWLEDDCSGTEAEWKAEQTKRKLAEEEAREKYERIYNACLLDKGKEVDMSVGAMRNAVQATCKDIAEDPSWLEELKYD